MTTAQDIVVKAYVDRTTVGLNEQFTLNVELSGRDANAASNPQLPKMDDFAIFLGSGTQQNMEYVNGRMSFSKVISYHFQATAIGQFQIGSIMVQAGGKQVQTDPISIEIQKTAAAPQTSRRQNEPVQGTEPAEGDLFLRTLVDKKQVYQNEPVTITYKIYTLVNVTSYGFSKIPGTAGFWVEEFPMGQAPETSVEILEGKRYTVATIRKVALFPMTPGEKTVEPLEIECEVRVQRRSRDIFDDFFSDPFGRTVRKAIQSEPVRVKVLPLPEEGKPEDFTGIVGKYRMTGGIDRTKVKTNEAISYKVKLEGQGNIRTLPEPKITFPSDFEAYPPKISETVDRKGSVVSGSKTFEYVLVPRAPGIQKIKPVVLSTFDPSAKTFHTLRTDEISIDVVKGDDVFITAPSGLAKEEVALIGQDIRFIKTAVPSFQRMGRSATGTVLFWAVLIFPLFCLTAAYGYRRHSDRLIGDVAYARGRRATHSAKKRLSSSKSLLSISTQKEFYAEAGRALMGYLGDKLNIAEAGMVTEEAERMLKNRSVSEETSKAYFECLRICDLKRFSPTETDENEMRVFFKKAEGVISRLHKEISK